MTKRKYGGTLSRSSKRRRTTSSKRRLYPRRSRVSRIPRWGPLGKRKMIPFTYCTEISLNPNIGAAAYHTFAANDLYDPDYSGVGHQPYGFDQMMAMYSHFTVVGAKITAECTHTDSVASIFFVRLRAGPETETDIEAIRERPGVVSQFMSPGTVGPSIGRLVKGFSARKFFGVKNIVGASQYRGSTAGRPTELAFFQVGMAPSNNGDNPGVTTVHIKLEFMAVLTEPKMLVQS